jgi:hypothetical protein
MKRSLFATVLLGGSASNSIPSWGRSSLKTDKRRGRFKFVGDPHSALSHTPPWGRSSLQTRGRANQLYGQSWQHSHTNHTCSLKYAAACRQKTWAIQVCGQSSQCACTHKNRKNMWLHRGREDHIPHSSRRNSTHIHRVGQNRIYTPYMTVYLVIPLPKIPYMHRIYMVLANPTYTLSKRGTFRRVRHSTLTLATAWQ